MPRELTRLQPANRHFLIVPHYPSKTNDTSGVLLPDDFVQEEEPYIEATVVDIAHDCSSQFNHLKFHTRENKKIVVDRTMIQEIKLKDKTHYMVLENYVVGFFRRADER